MKQAIVVRTDLGMGTGKLAAQVAHAALKAAEDASASVADKWKEAGQKKVVLAADGEQMLFELAEIAKGEGLSTAVIRDAGHTQLEPGTVTALAVGPGEETTVDRVTGELSLL